MTERSLRVAVGALALAGMALTSYLLYVRWSGGTLACTTGGCDTVQSSSYSVLLGVPVALLGLGAYTALFATAFFRHELVRTAGASLALASVGFGAYLVYVQLAVIDAVCEWCLVSDAILAALAVLSLLRLRPAE
jgi:uncharacterized membrane protein